MLCAYIIGALAALSAAAGTPDPTAVSAWRATEAVPQLDVRPRLDLGDRTLSIAPARAGHAGHEGLPPCVADVCQAVVEVPGFATSFGRPHRSELFVALLDQAGIEPFATIAWVFVATGFRVDWAPPALDGGDPAGVRGWGSVFLRLRLRVDPMNQPVFPVRHRPERDARGWAAFAIPRT
jgi:hypothetical protein